MNEKPSLWIYVAGVLIVMAVLISIVHVVGTPNEREVTVFCGGFLLGMFAMYIAVHLYRWR